MNSRHSLDRVLVGVTLALASCTPTPPEVSTEGPPSTTASTTTSDSGPSSATTGLPSTTGSTLDGTTDSGSASATTSTTTEAESSSSSGSESSSSDSGALPDCTPVLAELLINPGGSDDGNEWIRIYNPCDGPIDLGEYSLGWGGDDYTYGTADLSGTIEGDDCLLLGGRGSDASIGDPIYDLELDLEPDLQNGDVQADGIALFYGDAASIDPRSIPVDTVIYGGMNTSGLLGPDGSPPSPYVGAPGNDDGLLRTSLEPIWTSTDTLTPNDCPTLE